MNHGPILFFGLLITLATSWAGLVLAPHRQLSGLSPHVDADSGVRYPVARAGAAQQGAELYRSLGCAQCHSQQVRTDGYGSDVARGWGRRRSVARDYLFDEPAQPGQLRLGPDLANFGERCGTNDAPVLQHLFSPQTLIPNSLCPPSPFLFTVATASGNPKGLVGTNGMAWMTGWDIVPKSSAVQLAAYLRSLKTSVALPEASLKPVEEGTQP